MAGTGALAVVVAVGGSTPAEAHPFGDPQTVVITLDQARHEVVRALEADLAAAVLAGTRPGSEEANALAERHRTLLSTYSDCTHPMHACIARSYVEDPRYADYYEPTAPGLTQWLHDTIFANTEAHGIDPSSAIWE